MQGVSSGFSKISFLAIYGTDKYDWLFILLFFEKQYGYRILQSLTLAHGIGLCGAHRTGKTTMALECARDYSLNLVETTTSAVFAAHGLSPSEDLDFATRLWIQDKVLSAAEEIWQYQPGKFITDRTPLDMLAYTMAEVQGSTAITGTALQDYMARCYHATNNYFYQLILVQPGIPLVAAAGKAALNQGYMAHLNSLILGFCNDEQQHVPFCLLPRAVLARADRNRWLANKCSLPYR